MSNPPVVLREKIYVPIIHKDQEEVIKTCNDLFVHRVFADRACEACDFYQERPCSDCFDCANYLASYKLYNVVQKSSGVYVGLPYGERKLISKIFPYVKDLPVLDKTVEPEFKTALAFTGELRDYQAPAIQQLIRKIKFGTLRGILKAPARSGKTACAIALACSVRKRTLILTNQHDLCKQFYATCYGSDNQPALTNASKLKKPPVILATELDDFFKGDIVISTYQKFLSEIGKERLNKIKNAFGLLIIDEVHKAAAAGFLSVVAALNSRHKLGLTATVQRKDGMDVLVKTVLGRVKTKINVKMLTPIVIFHETNLHCTKDYTMWVYYYRWLERSDSRTDMIVKSAINDLKQGRSIIIPCLYKSQVYTLVRKINWEYGKKIAVSITREGASKADLERREEKLEAARQGTVRCVVGIRSIISTGVNVPKWDTLYWCYPLSNPPNWFQEYSRILTPLPNKKPIIRMFLDDSKYTCICLKSCLFKKSDDYEILAKFAIISKDQWKIANKYIQGRAGLTLKGKQESDKDNKQEFLKVINKYAKLRNKKD